jgi:hypothetical protein
MTSRGPERLEELVDAAAAVEARLEAAPIAAARDRRGWLVLGLVASVLVLGASLRYATAPSAIAAPPSAAQLEAGRRHALAIAIAMANDESRFLGHVPDALPQTAPLGSDLHYRRVGDGYEIALDLPDGRQVVVKGR